MQVLVTGGAGYIGSHTVRQLLNAGMTPVVYDNLSTGFREAVPEGVVLIEGDVRDSARMAEVMRAHSIEAVIHFAAKLVVPESVEKPLEYYENNVLGTLKTLEACAATGVKKFIFSSTAAVYGNPAEVPVPEEALPQPLNPYGMSKWMSEKILADFAKARKFGFVVLRYFNVAGAAVEGGNGQRTKNATHLVKVAAEAACGKRDRVQIFGTDYPTPDGTGVRDYIHVDDLAIAHVKALEYLQKGGASDVFNVGYGRGYSVRDVLRAMQKVASGKKAVEISIQEVPRRAGDAAEVVADNRKIQTRLGWTAVHDDLELICRTSFEWERGLSDRS